MQVSRRLSDGVIVQYGHGLGERPDCERLDVDEPTADAIKTHLRQSNGGVVLGDDGTVTALPAPKEPRYRSHADYAAEFNHPLTLDSRRLTILGIYAGLVPREFA